MVVKQKRKQIKHQEIYDSICSRILSGDYQPGQKIPTEKELAAHFSASRPTVGRAMRDLEQKGLIVRKQGVGTFVRKSAHVRGQTLGILIHWQTAQSDVNFSIFGSMIPEISRAASQLGYSLMLNDSPSGTDCNIIDRTRQIMRHLIDLQVAGVFFTPLELTQNQTHINREIADAFQKAQIAVTLLDRDIYGSHRRSAFDIVGINNREAAFTLTEHLIKLGCRKIDFVTGEVETTAVNDRICGYQNALDAGGVDPGANQIHHFDDVSLPRVDSALECRDTINFIEKIRSKEVEAVVCINDGYAANLMRFLLKFEIRIPQDVRIVGFDDLPINEYLPVPLTTIRQSPQALAYEAVRTMLDRIENPNLLARDIMVATELVVRDSCGAHL